MLYFVITFIALGSLSLVLLIVFLARGRLRWTTAVKRSLLMTIVWLGFAGLLHGLMARSADFLRGLPVSVLNLDLHFPAYGRRALPELTRRARQGATGREDWMRTTRTLIEHPWWVDDPEGRVPGPTGDPVHPARLWIQHLLTIETLPADVFFEWVRVDPPPVFSAPDQVEVGTKALAANARFGRRWVSETNWPYEIARLEFDEVRLDGEAVEFEVVEAPDSNAEAGRYAHHVLWFIQGLPRPEAPGETTLEIDYRLWAEPGRFEEIGPLTWGKRVRVVE